jgi:protein SCO1/2
VKTLRHLLECAFGVVLLVVMTLATADMARAEAIDHAAHAMHATAAAADMPGDSLYQLPVHFTTSGGQHLMLRQYAGTPVVVTMFYGTCKAACPMLTKAMTETAAALPPATREKIRFLMVSLDPARDTPEALRDLAQEYRLKSPRFELASTDANGVRLLAAALGIRYRQLPDGNFSHSSILTALDAKGVPRARTERVLAADPAFVSGIESLVAR